MTDNNKKSCDNIIAAKKSVGVKHRLFPLECKVCSFTFKPTNNCQKKCKSCSPASSRTYKRPNIVLRDTSSDTNGDTDVVLWAVHCLYAGQSFYCESFEFTLKFVFLFFFIDFFLLSRCLALFLDAFLYYRFRLYLETFLFLKCFRRFAKQSKITKIESDQL